MASSEFPGNSNPVIVVNDRVRKFVMTTWLFVY